MLLNRTQEHAVWRAVLDADTELASLRTLDSLGEMAAEAWRLLCRYDGRGRLRAADGSTDTRAFQRWALAFERRCRTERFLTQAQLEEALRGAIEKKLLRLPTEVALVGFDGMTPAQERLVETLRSSGVDVGELLPGVDSVRRMMVEMEDEQKELRFAARWVRGFLEEHPEARVAVIVPALETQRRAIDRVFREYWRLSRKTSEPTARLGPYEFHWVLRWRRRPSSRRLLIFFDGQREP